MKTFKTAKGTELPLIQLKGKDYLQVAHRLVWFREEHPDWGIETEVSERGDGFCVTKAIIKDEKGRVIATAHKYEDIKGFPDYHEKSETGAIGRALALCGHGTQWAHELDEANRIVDAPIERAHISPSVTVKPVKAQATGDQKTSLGRLLDIINSRAGAWSIDQAKAFMQLRWGKTQSKDLNEREIMELTIIVSKHTGNEAIALEQGNLK